MSNISPDRIKGSASRVVAKAADYTVTLADDGKFFTTTGASGAIIFTLPTPAAANKGVTVEFYNTVDQDMTISCTGKLVWKHDLAANTLAFSTSSEKIGGNFKATSDGSLWLVQTSVEEAQTVTVAT